jgi:hypothetical protein
LNAPTAGVSYGGHGVWGWDDGSGPPTDHSNAGTPLPWREAIVMAGAEQMRHVADLFTTIDFWRLRPAPEALAGQPGTATPARFIAVSRSAERDLLVAYTPEERTIAFRASSLPAGPAAWVNPRSGARHAATGQPSADIVRFETPAEGDWILLVGGGTGR